MANILPTEPGEAKAAALSPPAPPAPPPVLPPTSRDVERLVALIAENRDYTRAEVDALKAEIADLRERKPEASAKEVVKAAAQKVEGSDARGPWGWWE